MELCDVFDETGNCTGRIVARGTELGPGEYYLVAQVWIRNEIGEYLIQRRAPHLVRSPGIWAATAGQVRAGEACISGALREVNEELGVQLAPASLTQFTRLFTGDLMQIIWLAEVSRESIGTPVLSSEVSDWKWAFKDEIRQMIESGQFFAYSYIDQLPE